MYFKNSGEKITASANVSRVLQFTLSSLKDVEEVVSKYGKQICIVNPNPRTWGKLPKYCILIFLKDARYLDKAFQIDKTGFGTGVAWLCVDDIEKVKTK